MIQQRIKPAIVFIVKICYRQIKTKSLPPGSITHQMLRATITQNIIDKLAGKPIADRHGNHARTQDSQIAKQIFRPISGKDRN